MWIVFLYVCFVVGFDFVSFHLIEEGKLYSVFEQIFSGHSKLNFLLATKYITITVKPLL